MKVLIAGGTGFLGASLRRHLLWEGHQIYILTRHNICNSQGQEKFICWDPEKTKEWGAYFEDVDVVINLAGENIAGKRWTKSQKQKILQSRLNSTRMVITAISGARSKPSVLINASAVGFYGPVFSGNVTETNSRGDGFLADVCEQWEKEAMHAEELGVRVVLARLGPVLGKDGGMLPKMIFPYRFFLGGSLGSGKQWISWIHIDDVVRIFSFLMTHSSLSGPVNVTAPMPVSMKEFSFLLGKVLDRPSWVTVPSFVIRFMMGEMSSIVLEGQCVIPQKLLDQRYAFKYAELRAALGAVFEKKDA